MSGFFIKNLRPTSLLPTIPLSPIAVEYFNRVIFLHRPNERMKNWAPILKLSLAMLRLTASVVQVVTGLPIPLPDGPINKRTALKIVTGGVYCSKVL